MALEVDHGGREPAGCGHERFLLAMDQKPVVTLAEHPTIENFPAVGWTGTVMGSLHQNG
jgi:hypothetical protein